MELLYDFFQSFESFFYRDYSGFLITAIFVGLLVWGSSFLTGGRRR